MNSHLLADLQLSIGVLESINEPVQAVVAASQSIIGELDPVKVREHIGEVLQIIEDDGESVLITEQLVVDY